MLGVLQGLSGLCEHRCHRAEPGAIQALAGEAQMAPAPTEVPRDSIFPVTVSEFQYRLHCIGVDIKHFTTAADKMGIIMQNV